MTVTVLEFCVLASVLFAAACLQGSIGFGLGMMAAPVIALVDPSLLPASLILLSVVLTLIITVGERQHLDLRGVGWALVGRVPGSIVGAWLVITLTPDGLVWLVALAVSAGILAAFVGWVPPPLRRNLIVAGAASGILGTATSIGGTPMAIIWQRAEGPELRGTMSAFFLVGSCMSLFALALAGAINEKVLQVAFAMVPFVLAGFFLSRFLTRFLEPQLTRLVALAASSVGVLLLIGQQLLSQN
ncbi:sulfite exporter TauE/SafE family protein [Arthrobacter globiformis]|uniref:sulfite exporter TauE/SafE family protein n=1 Tax=Arthrobacter globiformis TaxID=1665 RepID=UPI002792C2B8|nr:sulfite exporter TauE/SafE family protein [Arthrobacter globiformis]MDQ0618343.1 putative membrane protein YfcA [Arthrobacter globiformis]